jgi:tripartite-type tricarboxylate transporter receptor subunit TctC
MLKPVVVGAILAAAATSPLTVNAQDYPSRPIRMVTSSAGGGSDLAARVISPGLAGHLGQNVIVDNRGAIVAIETVAKAAPDGYTLIYYGSQLWLLPLLRSKVSWDPLKDFSPVTLAVTGPNVLVVHPSVAAKSVKELIALAKASPGALNYSSGGIGSSAFMATELFKSMAGITAVHIPYNSAGPAVIALLGGQAQFMFPSAGAAAPHIKSGKLRALAVTTSQPSALAPGVPTMSASGLPGYESTQMSGVFAPAKTPAAIIRRLNQDIVSFLNTAETKERFLNSGVEVVGGGPEEFAAKIKSEVARMGKVIKDAGIREE